MDFIYEKEIHVENYFSLLSPSLQAHCHRAAQLAADILDLAKHAQLYDDETVYVKEDVLTAVRYHDIGMALIPEEIVNKNEDLSHAEYRIFLQHTTFGGKLLEKYHKSGNFPLQQLNMWQLAAQIAVSHHERWDGKGFPFGLRATAIPLAARATAIADAFDSFVSGTPWRMALPAEYALLEIINRSRTWYDPELIQLLAQHLEVLHIIRDTKKM